MSGNVSTRDEVISVGKPLPRISGVEPLDARNIRITWQTGETVTLDLAPALQSRRIYIPLRGDDLLFRQVAVNEYGDGIEWPVEDLEFSAAWLESLPSIEFSNADFRTAMERLGHSLEGMATALQISRRLVADYRKDKPIPRHIAFATRYMLEHQFSKLT
ncbi:DUF2442 domain-containing protein [Rhizobium sp. S152]|uniref:DUF2442 domain-containing protein n=1 Tax=Rhizobium sp. S152 TaxID=3055038 RepID=UPI0025AA032A|nr:DUF2442 domain-containing protein [Rhizobium sp. S152]MDM9626193.1 DUF2442 domain-containing protein [Rhizobium sp. S152]